MRHPHRVLALCLVLGCGGASAAGPKGPPPPATETGSAPRLVVSIVLDQLGADTFARLLPHLPEDGALRTLAREGAHHTVTYPFSATFTACGHTAIFTGASPRTSGIVSNKVWDRERKTRVAAMDDGEHAVIGGGKGFASPASIEVQTVADRLKQATDGHAKVVALSLKDRGAIPAAGRAGDMALWYDQSVPAFVTSRFYADAMPAWIAEWTKVHPLEAMLEPWTPEDPALLERVQGRDDQEGEGDWLGLGTTFPHEPKKSVSPWSAARYTPASSEYLLDLALAAAEQVGLGEDEVPDLLSVSVSGTDYVGHVFGPGSWEYLDNLVRVDRALARFLKKLEARGPIAVVLTSDHGAAPLAERNPAPSGRIPAKTMFRDLQAAVGADVAEAWSQPFVHLTSEADAAGQRQAAIDRIIAHLSKNPSLDAYDARSIAQGPPPTDPVMRALWESLPEDVEGDVLVVPKENFTFDEGEGDGSNQVSHGTPWMYDRNVPALVMGPGVTPERSDEPLEQARVTASLTALLGVGRLEHLEALPLPGVKAP